MAFDVSRRAGAIHFRVVERHNRIKMNELCPFKVGTKVASWPILVLWAENLPFWSHFLRYGLQISFAIISIDIKGQTKLDLEFNWT